MPFRIALGGYCVIAIIAILLSTTGILEPLDRRILDSQFAALRAWWPRPVVRDVVIVGIDEDTGRQIPEPISLWHRQLGKFLQASAAGRAAAVGIDIVLPDRTFDAIVPGLDRALLGGILIARRIAPLVLARTIDPEGQPRPIYPAFLAAAGGDAAAFVLLPIDDDGVVRRLDERLGGEKLSLFSAEIARRLGAPPRAGLIDYSRGAEFDYIPLQKVLALFDAGDTAALERVFADKPVLLGSVLKFEDRLVAPVNLIAWDREAVNVPGVVIHAQALRSMLGSGLIMDVSRWIVLAVCLIAALVWLIAAKVGVAFALIFSGSAAILMASTWLLARGWYFPPLPIFGTLLLAAGGRTLRETALQIRERRKLRESFSGYVSPSVLDEILAGQIPPELGGVNKFICALFSDIRGYTTRSEGMTPQQLVAFLNRYFEQVVDVIHSRGGTVISFMGDGIMAVFGAPKSLENPCADAFAAAREILDYIRKFNDDSQAAGEAPIEIGIGLHAGDAVVGHVGSSSRHNYTAIGDVINVASRLEGATKEVGYRIVCSRVVADMLPSSVVMAPLGRQAIKGHSPVESYGYDKV